MKKIILVFVSVLAFTTFSIAQSTPPTTAGAGQNAIFEEHLVTAFSLLALTPDQELSIRNEINNAMFEISTIKNSANLSNTEKEQQSMSRNELKNRRIRGILKDEKYTTWKKIRANQNELQDIPVLQ